SVGGGGGADLRCRAESAGQTVTGPHTSSPFPSPTAHRFAPSSRREQAPAWRRRLASHSSSPQARGALPRASRMLLLGVVGAAVGRVAGRGGDSLGFRGLLFLVLLSSLFPVWRG
ncbi:unnamed protein product, partial [Gulo gulo]